MNIFVYMCTFYFYRTLSQEVFNYTFTDLAAGTAYDVSVTTQLATKQSETVHSIFRTCKRTLFSVYA